MTDILIRMEMPKSCGFCELRYFDGDADCCPFVGDACGYGTRHADCPLIELPEHGDLIDRDEALKQIKPYSNDDERAAVTIWTAKRLVKTAFYKAPVIVPSNKEESE